MIYQIAEKFKSIQGEGVYAGTPMAFIRFVGCSVGKKICQHCDTDFEKMHEWRGGGSFSAIDLIKWTRPYGHICLTGGEPLDQELRPILEVLALQAPNVLLHIETSGTKGATLDHSNLYRPWVCVSPKPGYIEDVVLAADEIKVIMPGLGEITPNVRDQHFQSVRAGKMTIDLVLAQRDEIDKAFRWPTLADALRWAELGKTVFLQPRNGKFDIDQNNLRIVQDIIADHPNLRLSVQMHKILKVQ